MESKTRSLTTMGLCMALVTVATMVIKIPVPATNGYIHMGDSMIFLVAIAYGRKKGAICSGLGSALADILSGYAHWALFTFIIKSLMGYAVGAFSEFSEKRTFLTKKSIVGVFLGMIIMVVGYLIGGSILKGSFMVALTSVPENIVQGIGGMVVYMLLAKAMSTKSVVKFLAH